MSCDQRNESLFQVILRMLAFIGKGSHPEMFAHIQPHGHATARLVRYFARSCVPDIERVGLTLSEFSFGAHLHDVGKYLLSKSILLKPGRLNEEEYAAISLHPIYGANVLSHFTEITEPIRRIVLHHHEHWDGSGYPDGLSGVAIPIEARAVAIADVYTSLRSRRSYKRSLAKAEALVLMGEMAGRKLDPCLTEDFIALVRDNPAQVSYRSA